MANKKIVPVPEQCVDGFKRLLEIDTEVYDLKREMEIKSREVWSEVEKHYDSRGKLLKFNKEENHIEIIESDEDEDEAMLEKIRQGKVEQVAYAPAKISDSMGSALPRIHAGKPSWREKIANFIQKYL